LARLTGRHARSRFGQADRQACHFSGAHFKPGPPLPDPGFKSQAFGGLPQQAGVGDCENPKAGVFMV
jgi:hypothetical protein